MKIQEIFRELIDIIDQKAARPSTNNDPRTASDDATTQKTKNPIGREDAGLIPVEVSVVDNTEPDQTIMIPPEQASFEMMKKDSGLDNVYDNRGIEFQHGEDGSPGAHQVSTKKDELLTIQRLAGMPVISITN